MKTHHVWATRNAKTGPVDLCTYRTHGTCPTTCPLWGNGCYAENRNLFSLAEHGYEEYEPLIEALAQVRRRRGRSGIVRFNVTGDYLDDEGQPDMAYIEATNHAAGMQVLSYTHAWRLLEPDMFRPTTRPNASCDTLLDVTEARDAGWTTVIVDPYMGDDRWGQAMSHLDGFVDCLYDELGLQCVDCKLCSVPNRKSTVVFPVHGARKRRASEVLHAEAERLALGTGA